MAKSWKPATDCDGLAEGPLQTSGQKITINETPEHWTLGVVLGKAYARFVKIRGQPREIALGFALGIFIGMAPIMGFQTGVAIFCAALFKWSKISAALGVWITNPLSAPLIYSLNYVTGAWLLGVESGFNLHPDLSATGIGKMLQKAPQVFVILTIGGIVLGLPLAFISYYVSYGAVLKYQKNLKDKLIRQKLRVKNTKDRISRKIRKRKKRQKKLKRDL